jgi:tRNA modification GTPase
MAYPAHGCHARKLVPQALRVHPLMPTFACLVTGAQRAAIATISLHGPEALAIIDRNFVPTHHRKIVLDEVRYGMWKGASDERGRERMAPESVVLVGFDAASTDASAHRFFGPLEGDAWEIHCHGGAAAAQRILDDMAASGATVVPAEQWQRECGLDRMGQEATQALSRTTTIRTAAIALDQVRGAMLEFVHGCLAKLQLATVASVNDVHREIAGVMRYANVGMHLGEPWRVVLAGAPNVGKSSLINALVGYRRSITLDQPGTTRDVLEAHAVIDGWPLLLHDTAGLRKDPAEEIEREGIRRTHASLEDADLVLWVNDARDRFTNSVSASADAKPVAFIPVVNKIDLNPEANHSLPPDAVTTSALTGEGIETLRQRIIATLVPDVPPAGTPLPTSNRQRDCLRLAQATKDPQGVREALVQLLEFDHGKNEPGLQPGRRFD